VQLKGRWIRTALWSHCWNKDVFSECEAAVWSVWLYEVHCRLSQCPAILKALSP